MLSLLAACCHCGSRPDRRLAVNRLDRCLSRAWRWPKTVCNRLAGVRRKANCCALGIPPEMPYQSLARHYEPGELCRPEGCSTKSADSGWLVKVGQLPEQQAAGCVQTRYSKYVYVQLSKLRRREQQTWYARLPITFGANPTQSPVFKLKRPDVASRSR